MHKSYNKPVHLLLACFGRNEVSIKNNAKKIVLKESLQRVSLNLHLKKKKKSLYLHLLNYCVTVSSEGSVARALTCQLIEKRLLFIPQSCTGLDKHKLSA